MAENVVDNNKIAKNTLLLYLRMFVIMAIGLYTSRVVLQQLGVSDYGIYNVVGGFVAMLAYIKTGFISATQRFLSFSIGEGDMAGLGRIFSTSVSVYYILSFILFVLSESFGVWYIDNYLVIDHDRLYAAKWVFQCSMLCFIIEMLGVPYYALIIAHEKMDIYAYISVIESISKLVIVYVLSVVHIDKLILYAILSCVISLIVRFLYVGYSRKYFLETHAKLMIDIKLLKKMYAFAGWTAIGTLGSTFKDQLINLVLNHFGGTTVNAARGIAIQVSGIVNQFASNFLMAVSPQITKQYAAGQIENSRRLVFLSSKFTFYLMTIMVVPISVSLGYILTIWLGVVPRFTYEFVLILLFSTLIGTLASPITVAIQATGYVRNFQLGIAVLFLLEVPIAYYLLRVGYSPYIAVLPSILIQFCAVLFRYYILSIQAEGYFKRFFLFQIVFRSIFVSSVCYATSKYLSGLCEYSFLWFMFVSCLSIIITCTIIFFLGLNRSERIMVVKYINAYKNKLYNGEGKNTLD